MIFLKQSTASQEVPLGYFLDSTDGNTEETGLTINNADIKLWKCGATTLANKNSGGATHISNGIYYAVLDATDTDTLGSLVIFVHVSGVLTVRLECCVLAAAVYDALIGGGNFKADLDTIKGQSVTCAAGVTVLASVGTAAPGTAQTGDSYALANGANGFAALKTDTAAIKGKTDNLPADPASNTQVNTRLATAGYTAPDNASITAIKNKTDNLPADPASNTQVNTRLATAGYTAPDNAGIGAIKTQTDKMNFSGTDIKATLDSETVTLGNGPHGGGAATLQLGGAGGLTATVTGNLTGNVGGTINGLTANALADFFDTNSGTNYGAAAAGSVVKEIADNAGGSSLTAVAIRQEMDANSTQLSAIKTQTDKMNFVGTDIKATLDGETVTADAEVTLSEADIATITAGVAASVPDPWATALPGSYEDGTAGKILSGLLTAGAGPITWTYTLTEMGTGLPIADATIRVCTDAAGANIVAQATTNAFGVATFYLTAGMYYIFRYKAGTNFTNPDTEVVS